MPAFDIGKNIKRLKKRQRKEKVSGLPFLSILPFMI
jgi:hypothetical protein